MVRIALPGEVQPQVIRLGIAYDAEFTMRSPGLFKLSEDAVYSRFEAIGARRVFPCFDEPRFKTPFRMTLTVPKEMSAVSTTPVEVEALRGDFRVLAFRETDRLSTYRVALAVGQFDIVEGEIPPSELRTRSIPLRRVGLRSGEDDVLNRVTVFLEAIERDLGVAYPYEKLDVLVIPSFVAMPTGDAGLVVLSGTAVPAEALGRALAQLWLGNSVTMRWWDDSWFQNGLATWAGRRAAIEVHGEAPPDLQRVMERDALGSARSIRQPVSSNRDIERALDPANYAKGEALITMYERFVGIDRFRNAVGFFEIG
ncbi:MAG: M1 family aminopeptidase, partial [Myxococcota bacterium]